MYTLFTLDAELKGKLDKLSTPAIRAEIDQYSAGLEIQKTNALLREYKLTKKEVEIYLETWKAVEEKIVQMKYYLLCRKQEIKL